MGGERMTVSSTAHRAQGLMPLMTPLNVPFFTAFAAFLPTVSPHVAPLV
jgi:hypothetical protein